MLHRPNIKTTNILCLLGASQNLSRLDIDYKKLTKNHYLDIHLLGRVAAKSETCKSLKT